MTVSFPEIVEAFAGFDTPLVLDGEILAWKPGGTKRSQMVPKGRQTVRCLSLLCKRGWDASGSRRRCAKTLPWSSWLLICFTPTVKRSWRSRSISAGERWKIWSSGSSSEPGWAAACHRSRAGSRQSCTLSPLPAADSFARLVLAPAVQLQSVEQLEQAYVDARARGNEGVMLKARHSIYQPGGAVWPGSS